MSRINPQDPSDIPKREVPSSGFAYSERMAFHPDRGVRVDENGRVSIWENQAMAFRIKPEDIDDYLAAEILRPGLDCAFPNAMVALILNEAIEAGLVSPPCHVHRYLGELECQGGTLDPALFIGKPKKPGDEHWKGQTE